MRLKDARILVTGAGGLIGRHLVARLAAQQLCVRATVHRQQPADLVVGVEYLTANLTKAEDCAAAVAGIDFVFHCAAVVHGAAATAANPLAAVNDNMLIHVQLLDAAYRAGVRKFLWLGSTTGYPPAGDRPLSEEEFLDGAPFEKYFAVGWMSRYCELLCQTYAQKLAKPMTTLVLRPTNVYGPGERFDFERSHVAAALLRRVVERQDPLEVWGTGDDIRDLVYVDDVVHAMIMAMDQLDAYTTLNIGLGKGYSVKEILRILLDLEGFSPGKIVFDASKPTMIPVRLVDVSAAARLLGFKAEVDLPEGLGRTMAWYKTHRHAPVR